MKTFTILSTAILISSVTASSSKVSTVTNRSALNLFTLESMYVFDTLKSLIWTPSEHSIHYKISPPEPETAGIDAVSSAAVNFDNEADFYKKLSTVDNVHDVIFHPGALYYLASLEAGKLLATGLTGDKLKKVLYELMIRSKTLTGRYSSVYVGQAYASCMTHMYGLVTEIDKSQESWPCAAIDKCEAGAADVFRTAALSFKECKEVLSPQVNALADVLSSDLKSAELLKHSAKNVRDSIKHVILDSHYTNAAIWSNISGFGEITSQNAAKKLSEVLAVLKKMDETNSGLKASYDAAESEVNVKFAELDNARLQKECELESKIVANATGKTAEVTKTVIEPPTKTEVSPVKEVEYVDTKKAAKPTETPTSEPVKVAEKVAEKVAGEKTESK